MGKTRKPYNPAKDPAPSDLSKQLGVPTQYRRQHSPKGAEQGFDIMPLASGFDRSGGVVRSRERAMLTPLGLQQAMLQEAIEKKQAELLEQQRARGNQTVTSEEITLEHVIQHMRDNGLLRMKIALTPSDEVIIGNPRIVHDYITTHKEAEAKTIKIANYEGSISAGDIHRLPLNDKEFERRHFYAYIQEKAPLAVQKVLAQICEQCNPEVMARISGREPEQAITKAQIGRHWTRRDNSDRDAVNNADGVLALACAVLAEIHSEYSTEIERAKRLAKIAHDHRKKAFA